MAIGCVIVSYLLGGLAVFLYVAAGLYRTGRYRIHRPEDFITRGVGFMIVGFMIYVLSSVGILLAAIPYLDYGIAGAFSIPAIAVHILCLAAVPISWLWRVAAEQARNRAEREQE